MRGSLSARGVGERIARHVAGLGSPNQAVARRAESYLMRQYGAEALQPLVAACAGDDPQVRYRAVWALAHTRDSRAFDTVLRLTRDPDAAVRYDAAIGLGVLGDARAVGPLIALLQEPDEEHAVDSAAAMGLERLGGAAVPALITLIFQLVTGHPFAKSLFTALSAGGAALVACYVGIILIAICASFTELSDRRRGNQAGRTGYDGKHR